jgi:hypothetical protein
MASDAPSAPRFFVLEADLHGRCDTLFSETDPVNTGPAPRCPQCGELIGMRPWLPPYRGELELYGEELGDFVKAAGYDFLISERFAEGFREEGLIGLLGFHPVEILRVGSKGRKSKAPFMPRYFAVTACFGRGAVDETLSRLRRNKPVRCSECRSTGVDSIHGLVLDPGTWQGEDVFRPRGEQGSLLVSKRFARFAQRHRLTNLRLTPSESFIWDPLGRGPPAAAPPIQKTPSKPD